MDSLDLDKSGSISISELSVAFIDFQEVTETQLKAVFNYFDYDGDGFITLQEM